MTKNIYITTHLAVNTQNILFLFCILITAYITKKNVFWSMIKMQLH